MKRLVLAVLFAAFAAAPAEAVTLVTPDGRVAQPYQRWADRSYAPTPAVRVVVTVDRTCGSNLACSGPDELFLAPEAASNREAFLYELGHEFDYALTSPWDGDPSTPLHDGYRRIVGRVGVPWWGGDAFTAPGEVFAGDYGVCAVTPPRERVALPRSSRQVCALIDAAGRKAGWPPGSRESHHARHQRKKLKRSAAFS